MTIERIAITQRDNWRQVADNIGYNYYDNGNGTMAWNESNVYSVTKDSLNQISIATETMHRMCLNIVDKYIRMGSDGLNQFHIPQCMHAYIQKSWERDPFLIGRFDWAWTPSGLKMIEYNADTPATIPESTIMMALWLKNYAKNNLSYISYYRSLSSILSVRQIVKTLRSMRGKRKNMHIIPYPDNTEDKTHAVYWSAFARKAGWNTSICELRDFNISASNQFESKGKTSDAVIRMYPWEFMLREPGRQNLYKNDCLFLNPAWTSLLSNKALLPLLWKEYPGHPLLLQAYHEHPHGMSHYVAKPIHSRGGENVNVFQDNAIKETSQGTYSGYPDIYQEFVDTRVIDSNVSTSVGSWIVGNRFAGLTFREDSSLIVKNCSAIVPHYVG